MRLQYSLLASALLGACTPDPKDTGEDSGTPDSGDSADTNDSAETGNAAPTAPTVAITPAHPADVDGLTVTLLTEATDPDGDALTYTYAWSQNGSPVASATGEAVSADLTADGDVWAVAVTAFDGQASGPAGTATVTIGNAAPSAPVVHIDPAAPVKGDDLTLVFDTPAVDPEGDALIQTIRWTIDDAANPSFDDTAAIPGVYVDPGEVWVAEVSVTDGTHDPVVVTTSVTVADTPPEVTSISISPTDPYDMDSLTARARATDADGDPLTFSYRWYRDGVEAVDVGDSDTVPDSATTVGEQWYVEVTVDDGNLTDSLDAAPVYISAPSTVTYGWQANLLIAPDGAGGWASATGVANLFLTTTGTRYGATDCDIWWTLATTGQRACRGCEFSFDTQYTYDAASSTDGSPAVCAGMELDSAGYLEYLRTELTLRLDDPAVTVYYYGYPYIVQDYVGMTGEYGTYGYSYDGMSRYNTVTSYEDPYGYMHMDMYVFQYIVK